jgi:hypothetical protein
VLGTRRQLDLRQRQQFLNSASKNGNDNYSTWQTTKAPGNGIIMTRFFIEDDHLMGGLGAGDNRGFTSDPNASARFTIAWDTDTGTLYLIDQPSCVIGICIHAHPTGGYNDLSNIQSLHDAKDGSLGVSMSYMGTDAAPGGDKALGRITGNLFLRVLAGGHIQTQIKDGTPYPSVEAYQYLPGQSPKTLIQDQQSPSGRGASIYGPQVGLGQNTRFLSRTDGLVDNGLSPDDLPPGFVNGTTRGTKINGRPL